MRVLFCGDRYWDDPVPIQRAFDRYEVTLCIHGAARGADSLAGREAKLRGIPVVEYPANWKQHGRAAGPIRNRLMLSDGRPDLVLAFHSDIDRSKGTKDMLIQARRAGVPTELVV